MNHVVRSITVDQIGYPIYRSKVAIATGKGGTYQIVNALTNAIVLEGETGTGVEDKASGAVVYLIDFSELKEPGRYYIELGSSKSAEFIIHERPYGELHKGLLKAFYFYRCGVELEEEYAGPWAHKACHLAEGIVYGQPELRLDCAGGWHDAGDYGKYSGPGAKAIADLLLAYELYPSAFEAKLPLPESDDLMPDVLHECRVELEWLFKMQEKDTGGVYHKLTTAHFPGLDVMPEDDLAELYFSPVSKTATANVAAVMALAARIYQPFDQNLSERCLSASTAAWGWLQDHPEAGGFHNPPEITTGEYGDEETRDEVYWAAAELYRTTGDEGYHHVFQELAKESFSKYSLGWGDMGGYGSIAYLQLEEDRRDAALYQTLKEGLLAEADVLISVSKQDGYRISLRVEDYIWGSNMVVMNQAMLLLIAYHLSGDASYENCALDHVHYLMGRNVLDISYVTGYGDRPVMYPHHRPSVGDHVTAPVSGLVVGGPDRGLHDDYVREHLQGKPAAQCFADHEDSYSTNEVTIYWNSPAVFVVSHFHSNKQ